MYACAREQNEHSAGIGEIYRLMIVCMCFLNTKCVLAMIVTYRSVTIRKERHDKGKSKMEDDDRRKKRAAVVVIGLFLAVAALGFAVAAMQGDSLLTGDNANDTAFDAADNEDRQADTDTDSEPTDDSGLTHDEPAHRDIGGPGAPDE